MEIIVGESNDRTTIFLLLAILCLEKIKFRKTEEMPGVRKYGILGCFEMESE